MHLRWAVAEIAITIETASAGLDAAERALGIFSSRALALIESLEAESQGFKDACYAARIGVVEARTSLSHAHQLRAERAQALHAARRKLHAALVLVAEAWAREDSERGASVSGFDAPELGSLLSLRQMFSAFRGGLISAGEQRSRLNWALEVAAAELSVLAAYPVLHDLPPRSQRLVYELTSRVLAWGSKQGDLLTGRALYRQASAIPELANELSAQPLLLEHDARVLCELSAVLANEAAGKVLETKVLSLLWSVRGLDTELDRLELNLVYGAAGVLGTLSMRVAALRDRLSSGHPHSAAS